MRLIHKNGKEVQVGDEVVSFRGEKATVISIQEPHTPASTGRLYVKEEGGWEQGYYPSVFDCEWEGRTDR